MPAQSQSKAGTLPGHEPEPQAGAPSASGRSNQDALARLDGAGVSEEENGGSWLDSLESFGRSLLEGLGIGEDEAAAAEDDHDHLWSIPVALATGDVGWIQERVDALDALAQAGKAFSEDDKAFVRSLYRWIGVGGYAKGLPEAGELMIHYVGGSGKPLEIDSEVYEESAIVRRAMAAIKEVIAEDLRQTGAIRNGGAVASTDVLAPTRLGDQEHEGEIIAGGYLLAEQGNRRLKYANNRFRLQSFSEVDEGFWFWEPDRFVETRWRVDDVWDFESYAEQAATGRHDVSVIPLPEGASLSLPDGLSAALVDQGVAAEFAYFAEWTERWTPADWK